MCATELSAREPGRKARPGEETGPRGTAERDGAGSGARPGAAAHLPGAAASGERGRRWEPAGAGAGGGGDRGGERGGSGPSLTR